MLVTRAIKVFYPKRTTGQIKDIDGKKPLKFVLNKTFVGEKYGANAIQCGISC